MSYGVDHVLTDVEECIDAVRDLVAASEGNEQSLYREAIADLQAALMDLEEARQARSARASNE